MSYPLDETRSYIDLPVSGSLRADAALDKKVTRQITQASLTLSAQANNKPSLLLDFCMFSHLSHYLKIKKKASEVMEITK